MKKKIFTLCIVLFSFANVFAQAMDDILLDDFESGQVSFTTEVHINPDASFAISVVDNPVTAGINTSAKVWKWQRLDTGDNQSWAGFWAILANAVPAGYAKVEVKYLRTNATSQLRMKIEGTVTKEFDPVTLASKTNEWETIVFDLTANGIQNINVLSLFPDNYSPIDPAALVYIDDIKVIYEEQVAPPVINSLTLFDNSASDRFHDQSWINQTAPSTVITENPAGPGMTDGDKFPVVTTPVKSDPNALKLQWKSVEGGNWMAMVAAIGWTSFDLTKMKYLKFWINSPVALPKTTLPKFYFQSHNGTLTGKLMLESYLTSDLVADTWTEVSIPLVDIWATDEAFSDKNVIKGIFFEQNATDNLEHTLFMDDFKFVNDNIVLDDFESGEVTFTEEVHGNPPAHMDFAVVDNPFKTGINTSDKVWEWARYDAETENKIWAGFWAVLKTAIPSGYNWVEIKYLRTNATSQLRIKCEGAITKEMDPVTPASKTNEWETLRFDLTANGIKNVTVFGFFPDYYVPIDPNAVTYIDDIVFVKDEDVIVPPPPSSMVLFDDSSSDRFHDQSWVNQTAPSTVATENPAGPGMNDGDKLPVVTSPVKAGTNALKLQWKSVETGDWKAMTASIGWQIFDLTMMKEVKFWVNSPEALATTALPKIYLEASGVSAGPSITGKLLMSDYLPNGLTADTWTEVVVPLADFWAADPTFVSKDLIKDVFFSQNATDNVEHIMYLDEFIFESESTGINTHAAKNAISAYYSNGKIIISNYSGNVKVFDLVGRKVAEGPAYDGKFPVSLKNGVYIVNTTQGNSKIVLQ